jgi:hypothetical protein
MLFDFKLRPIAEVAAWGQPPDQSLSWFGFTDGYYRLDLGGVYLLNYSPELVDLARLRNPERYPGPYVDYHVARLWEDVHGFLHEVLRPLPRDLQAFLERDYAEQKAWHDKAFAWVSASEPRGLDPSQRDRLYEAATFWRNERRLDSGYLEPAARVWLWSDEENVVIAWDNRGILQKGVPVWSADRGTHALRRGEFLAEVRSFHDRLIAEMADRVTEICAGWDRPEIRIDFEQLRQEQADRAARYDSALKGPPPTYSWSDVREAMALISKS